MFKASSRRNPCPVCDDTKGKCRHSHEDLILCMNYPDGGDLPGWKFVKPSKDGLWGLWVPVTDNPQPYIKPVARSIKPQYSDLTSKERDRQIRDLHRRLGLRGADRERLKKRGLNDAQIEAGLFFSLEREVELDFHFPYLPDNFPGVYRRGDKRYLRSHQGIAIPAFDERGLAIGLQIRVENPGEGGKYRWLKNSHLSDGELPLTVARPSEIKNPSILLTEGILKPYIAAQKHGAIAIGASGGNFCACALQLQTALKTLKARSVLLCPDGGSVQNRHVFRQYSRLKELLEGLDVSLEVLWWGQTQKSHSDIDEIESLALARAITWDEFARIAAGYSVHCPSIEAGRASQSYLSTKADKRNEVDWHTLKQQRELEQAWENWRKAGKFTPTTVVNQRYISINTPAPNTLIAIKSPMATGKSFALKKIISALPQEGWVAFGHRNALLLQNATARNWGFYHYQSEVKGNSEFIEAKRYRGGKSWLEEANFKICFAIDSILHFSPEFFEGKNIIIDECVAVCVHWLRSGTAISQYREAALERLKEALNRAKRIFIMDANLNDEVVAYLCSFLEKPIDTLAIENQYVLPNKPPLKFYNGDENSPRNRSLIVNLALSNPNPIVVASDSKIEILALAEQFKRKGAKGVLTLTSNDAGQPWVRELLEEPASYIKQHKIEKFLYSPTGQDGLDFSGLEGYFSDGYFLFSGVVTTVTQTQMLERIRDDLMQRHVFCVPTGIKGEQTSRSFSAERVGSALVDYQLEVGRLATKERPDLQSLVAEIIRLSCDSHFLYESQLIARENFERSHLRECLKEALSTKYSIEEISGKWGNTKEIQAIKQEIQVKESTEIFNAEAISTSEADRVASEFGLSLSEKQQIVRRRLIDRVPGIERTPYWEPLLVKMLLFDRCGLLAELETQFLLANPDLAVKMECKRWRKLFERFLDESVEGEKKIRLAKSRSRLAKVKALEEIGIGYFLEPGRTWNATKPEVMELWRRSKSPRITRALGMAVGKSEPVRWLNRLLRSLSFEISFSGKTCRTYSLKPMNPTKQTLLMCIAQRFESLREERVDFEGINVAQSYTQQGSEGAAHSPRIIKKQPESCAASEPVSLEGIIQPSQSLQKESDLALSKDFQSYTQQGSEGAAHSPRIIKKQPESCAPSPPDEFLDAVDSEFLASPDIQWLGREYLPLISKEDDEIAAAEMRCFINVYGDGMWRNILAIACREVQIRLISLLDPEVVWAALMST